MSEKQEPYRLSVSPDLTQAQSNLDGAQRALVAIHQALAANDKQAALAAAQHLQEQADELLQILQGGDLYQQKPRYHLLHEQ